MPKRRERGEWFTFTVEGAGEFPFDMLRYDSCWPKRGSHDSGKLSQHYSDERRRVVLVTCDGAAPTPARWESFGWRYVGDGELRIDDAQPLLTLDAIKKETMRIFNADGVISAVRFYRAAIYRNGAGRDPGLKTSIDLIRDKWAKEAAE